MARGDISAREEFVGRFAAICVHPTLAWRRISRLERQLIVVAYFSAGYVAGLALLIWTR
jgi:hypothetical protein